MKKVLVMFMMVGLFVLQVQAADVTLTGIDGFGTSSFNTAGLWDNAAAPSAGNDYFVPDGTRLRTPPDGGVYTFAGDSLTINNTTPYGDGIMYKGTGSTGSLTINNLILDGGLISHANGTGDICNLYGVMTIASGGGRLYAKQGPINVYSAISGSATIANQTPDGGGDPRRLTFYSPDSTFTGNIVNNGLFTLAAGDPNAVLNFVIGANGVNNSVSGTGASTIFNGNFNIDLSAAGTTLGDSWAIVTASNVTYGATFAPTGFTDMGDDTWIRSANGVTYQFDESTGILTVILAPATILSGPSDTTIDETQTAIFTTVFTSESTPVVTWYKVASPADIPMDAGGVQTTYDAQADEYTSTLTINNAAISDAGQYYCQVNNDSGFPQNSNTANLTVNGLVAHWTLDQSSYVGGNYLEEIAGYDAAVNGTPTFVTGADGTANHAVQVSATDGWALCPPLNPVNQSGQMTVSFWANWGEPQGTQQDLLAESTNNDQLVMTNGLVANGQWQHICVVFDGSNGTLFVDGVQQDTGAWSPLLNINAAINIGIDSNGQNPFNGAMDDMRLYNYALTGTEVAAIHDAWSSSCPLQYDLTGPSGQPDCTVDLYDLAAFANDWIITYNMTDFADFATEWQSSGP